MSFADAHSIQANNKRLYDAHQARSAPKFLGRAPKPRKAFRSFSRLPKKNTYVGSAKSRGATLGGSPLRVRTTPGSYAPPTKTYINSKAITINKGLSRNTKIGIGLGVGTAATVAGALAIRQIHKNRNKARAMPIKHATTISHGPRHATVSRHRNVRVRRGPHGHFAGSY